MDLKEKEWDGVDWSHLSLFLNWYSGGWSPIGSTRHCGHLYAYCANPGGL
jgi:hypothetical protein